MEMEDYTTIAMTVNLVITVPFTLIACLSMRNPLPILYSVMANICAAVSFATGVVIAVVLSGFVQFLAFLVVAPMTVMCGFGLCVCCPLLMPLAVLTVINFIVGFVFF